MLTRSRSKVRRSRGKVRRSRSKVRRSRSKVRRSRSKVSRGHRKRHDGLNFANDGVIISNEDIKKATEDSTKFGEALTNSNRGDQDIIVKSLFNKGVVFDNDNKILMITGKIINYSKDENKIDQLKSIIEDYLKRIDNPVIRFTIKGTRADYTKKLSKIEDIDKPIIRFITNEKDTDYTKTPCKIEDILDAFNDEMRGDLSNIFVYTLKKTVNESSLINKISAYTKISVPNLKKILAGVTIATLGGIAYYLSKNNKNMSKKEIENYLVKMVNKKK